MGHLRALPFLGEALAVEATKDSVKVLDLMDLIDSLVNCQQRCPPESLESVPSTHASLKLLQKNLKSRGLDRSKAYGILSHKMSLLYLHEGRKERKAIQRALRLAKTSVKLLREHQHDND